MSEDNKYHILIMNDQPGIDTELRNILSACKEENPTGFTTEFDSADSCEAGLKFIAKSLEHQTPYLLVFFNIHSAPEQISVTTITKIAEAGPKLQIVICAQPGQQSEAVAKRFGQEERFYIVKVPLVAEDVCNLVKLLIKKWVLSETVNNLWSLRTVRGPEKDKIKLKEIAGSVINACGDGIMIFEAERPKHAIVYVNPAFEKMTGYTSEEILGKNCLFLQGEDRDQPEISNIHLALEKKSEGRATLRNYRKGGVMYWAEIHVSPITDEADNVSYFVGMVYDVTSHKTVTEKLSYQATHDTLTGLPNRGLLIDRIHQSLIFAKRYGMMLAILFFDLDYFKTINDTVGHTAGDAILQTVAGRLNECIRETDTVARLGGDEFVVVLNSLLKEEDYLQPIQRILTSLAQPVYFEGRKLSFTSSAGVSLYPKNGQDAHVLLKNADTALYRAKELGRNNFQMYRAGMKPLTKEGQQALKNDLQHALLEEEFVLHYQPVVDIKTKKMIGIEVLPRWLHPNHGLIPPNMFIPLAEESGLMIPIGEWILKTACTQNKAWQNGGLSPITMSINLSKFQFLQKDFLGSVVQILKDTKLPPKFLEFELTEAAVKDDAKSVLPMLLALREVGIELILDKFGADFSDPEYLMQFPIQKIKIDQSFISNLPSKSEDVALVKSVIAAAHNMKIRVLAMGVETQEQVDCLQEFGVDEVQGYYFSRPITSQGCTQILLEGQSLPLLKEKY